MRLSQLLASLVLLLSLVGCAGQGTLNVANVEGSFNQIAERHDKYVTADTTLTPLAKEVYLQQTSILRSTIAEARHANPVR